MPKPHDVAHLVGHDVPNEGLGEVLLARQRAGRRQERQREVTEPGLLHRFLSVLAAGMPSRRRSKGLRAVEVRCGRHQPPALNLGVAHDVGVHRDVRVQNLAGERVYAEQRHGVAVLGRSDPPYRVVAHVRVIPIGIVRHLLDHDRVPDSCGEERLVPVQKALLHRIAVLGWNGVVHPEDDGLLGRRHGRLRIGLLQSPAVDVAHNVVVNAVLAEVPVVGNEVADARIGDARHIAVVLQCKERVDDLQRDAAGVRKRTARIGHHRRQRAGAAAFGEVVVRHHDDVLGEHPDTAHLGLVAVHGVGRAARRETRDARSAGEERADLGDIAPEEVADVDQQALALRLLGLDLERLKVRVGERSPDRTRDRVLLGRPELVVRRHEQNPLVIAHELEDQIVDRRPGNDRIGCPRARGHLEHHQLVELGLGDLHVDGVPARLPLAVDREQSLELVEVLHGLVNGLVLLGFRLGGAVGCGGCPSERAPFRAFLVHLAARQGSRALLAEGHVLDFRVRCNGVPGGLLDPRRNGRPQRGRSMALLEHHPDLDRVHALHLLERQDLEVGMGGARADVPVLGVVVGPLIADAHRIRGQHRRRGGVEAHGQLRGIRLGRVLLVAHEGPIGTHHDRGLLLVVIGRHLLAVHRHLVGLRLAFVRDLAIWRHCHHRHLLGLLDLHRDLVARGLDGQRAFGLVSHNLPGLGSVCQGDLLLGCGGRRHQREENDGRDELTQDDSSWWRGRHAWC